MGLRKIVVSRMLVEMFAKNGGDGCSPVNPAPDDLCIVGARMNTGTNPGELIELLARSNEWEGGTDWHDAKPWAPLFSRVQQR